MSENSNYIVGGYCFGSAEDAEMARQEAKKVEYLEQHMDYGKTENIFLVYQKAIESRIFQTPIGWEYLKKLQRKMKDQGKTEEEIPPIALYTVFAHRVGDQIKVPAPRIAEKKKETWKGKLAVSVLINVLLAAAVGAMFFIATTSENPNVLNYEKAIVNKYAVWEQELSQREDALREREQKLSEELSEE